MLCHIFDVGVGQTFSESLFDFTLFGILQGNEKTHWINAILIGLPLFPIYYFTFRFLITKFNFKTPGREDDSAEVKLYTRQDVEETRYNKSKNNEKSDLSSTILDGLGGKENVTYVDCCATRLRISVIDNQLVNKALLQSTDAKGVFINGQGVQIVYGPHVTVIKLHLEDYINQLA